ncbi:hypothetical protein TNCV_3858481 [Trichonephila clavipes]|nr:hypothetical protein TNCV_3858481 [Trichonephila clavipes]
MQRTSSSMPALFTSSSSTQAHLLSTSSAIPAILCESQSSVSKSIASTENILHTSLSSLPTEARLFPFPFEKIAVLSIEIPPSVPLLLTATTTSNCESSNHLKFQRV